LDPPHLNFLFLTLMTAGAPRDAAKLADNNVTEFEICR